MSPHATVPRAAAVLLLAVATVEATLLFAFATGPSFASWWSSVGLAVALVAQTPVRRWPLAAASVLVVVTAVHLAHGADPGAATADGLTRALQALVGAAVLTRLGRRHPRLTSLPDLVTMLAASLACGVVAVGEAALRWSPGLSDLETLVQAAAQHSVSTLLLCSLVLLADRISVGSASAPELMAQVVAFAAVTGVVFSPGQDLPLSFSPLPLLIWAALRFEPGVAAAELVGFAVITTLATSWDAGPIASARLNHAETGTVVLTYVVAAALITLPLALIVSHRLELLARVNADESLFRRNFAESPLGMVLLRLEAGELVVEDLNAAAGTMLKVRQRDVVGRGLGDVLDAFDRTDPDLVAMLRGESDTWHGHAAALERPGSRLQVAVAAFDWRDGTRIYSAQLLDLTQEHDVHRRLVDADRLNDATLDTTACIIMVTDVGGSVVRVNAATRVVTGFDDDEMVGHSLWDTPVAPLTRSETEAMFVWPNRSGYPMVSERLTRTASGVPLRIVWNNNVVLDDQGSPSYAVLTGIDVTAERSSTGLVSHLLSASIATALVGVDAAGRVTLFNAGAAVMLGWSAQEMLGRPFVDLFDLDQLRHRTGTDGGHTAFLRLVEMIGDRAESPARDWGWRTRHGHELTVSMTLSMSGELGEGRVGFLCVGRDVTEQREGQETLVAALDRERTAAGRLRALDRAKDEFVSTVSHELRTPVTSIIGYTEMLRDGTLVAPSPEQVPLLETIARNSQRLVEICNDLLLLSGFEAGADPGVRTRVDLRSCVATATDTLAVAPSEQGVTLLVHPGLRPLEVAGDRRQLDRLVANLLSNAVKFTPAGGRVTATLDHDGDHALLTVSDTGIGIPPEDHASVFQRFYRSEEAQSRAIPGTGLGLSIVAAIVAAHEGRISLESEPGRGSTFRVSIPLSEGLPPVRRDEILA